MLLDELAFVAASDRLKSMLYQDVE